MINKIMNLFRKSKVNEKERELELISARNVAQRKLYKAESVNIDIYDIILTEETDDFFKFDIKYRKRFTEEILVREIIVVRVI